MTCTVCSVPNELFILNCVKKKSLTFLYCRVLAWLNLKSSQHFEQTFLLKHVCGDAGVYLISDVLTLQRIRRLNSSVQYTIQHFSASDLSLLQLSVHPLV